MVWWRRFLAEIFPGWHQRRLIASRKADDGSKLSPLQRYRRKIEMSDPKPVRDVPQNPAPNPDRASKGDKPASPRPPPSEVPHHGEHVPTRTPETAKR
jgi:hypothetical protein